MEWLSGFISTSQNAMKERSVMIVYEVPDHLYLVPIPSIPFPGYKDLSFSCLKEDHKLCECSGNTNTSKSVSASFMTTEGLSI
jgi:hypothetical protein